MSSKSLDENLAVTVKSILSFFPWNTKAIILFGSMASHENLRTAKDIDLCILEHVYDPFVEFRVGKVLRKMESEIRICHYPIWHFNKLNTMLAFDVRNAGKVIYGDPDVLKKTDPKSIHKFEAIKILFNYGVVKLISCVSSRMLKSGRFSEDEASDLVYSCMKAFEGICTALLILRGRYCIGYKARADALAKIYQDEYPALNSQMPELLVQITMAVELRLGLQEFNGNHKDLWFYTKDCVERILPFAIQEYFQEAVTTRVGSVKELNKVPSSTLSSLMYVYRLFMKFRKIPPASAMLVQPITKVHIASACTLMAIDSSLNIDDILLREAEGNIKAIYPSTFSQDVASLETWEGMRKLCVALNEESVASQVDVDISKNEVCKKTAS